MVRCLSASCGLAGTGSLCKHLLEGSSGTPVHRAGPSLKEGVGVPSLWGVGSQRCCALCCLLLIDSCKLCNEEDEASALKRELA